MSPLALGLWPASSSVGSASTLFRDVAPWLGVLVALIIGGSILITWLRKVARGGDDQAPGGEGFTLHQLREMHASGLLSDEEFDRARDEMVGRLKSGGGPRSPAGDDGRRADEPEP